MFSRNVQFAPGGRNNRRRPRRSVREASDDRGFNGSGWPDFTWENGDISALPGRSCFPTDTFDHRCIRRRCPESLPLPRHRSHKYVNRSGSILRLGTPCRPMTDRDKGLCCAIKDFMHAIAFRLHSRKFFMREFHYAKEHVIARTFHEAYRAIKKYLLLGLLLAIALKAQPSSPPAQVWAGIVRTAAGEPVAGAKVTVFTSGAKKNPTAVTGTDGRFAIADLRLGPNRVSVQMPGRGPTGKVGVNITSVTVVLTVSDQNMLSIAANPETFAGVSNGNPNTISNAASGTSGGKLSSQKVNELPLNGRDFSTLLLLTAGTMTDVNGQTNFTQQFAINGQRGVEAVFAMDDADVSDPEMGGSTFTNFNVDAIQELQSSSGWIPADIGRGAAGFTNIVTRSGKSGFHGSFFEFLRNSALDARNYFDHPSIADPGRIPPFRRNEFGFTNGGPVVLPNLYDGRDRTFYFVQYQGLRQVLGTTQLLAVPTAAERAGQDVVTYSDGSTDMLHVPVNPAIAKVLARYPLPNNPTGAYGARTYAAPSNVNTDADQFSVRIDQKVGAKGQLFGRFNYDNLTGPTTNPDQTLIGPSFGVQYVDRQRNGVISYTRTVSPRFLWSTSVSFTRTTPSFVTPNHTDPALKFIDGLYEAFNGAAGSVMSAFGDLFQGQLNASLTSPRHAVKWGVEARLNRDTTYFGISPNGEYDFGGGTVYSPVFIPSASGQHDVRPGQPLPNTLASLLVGYPYGYTVGVAAPYFSNAVRSVCADYGASASDFEFSGCDAAGGAGAGVCDQSAAWVSVGMEWVGAASAGDVECAGSCAGACGWGDHGDSAEYLAGQFFDGVDAVCGVSEGECVEERGDCVRVPDNA